MLAKITLTQLTYNVYQKKQTVIHSGNRDNNSFFTQTYKGKAGCEIYVPKKQSMCEFTAIFPARKTDRQKMKKETITSQNTEIL